MNILYSPRLGSPASLEKTGRSISALDLVTALQHNIKNTEDEQNKIRKQSM